MEAQELSRTAGVLGGGWDTWVLVLLPSLALVRQTLHEWLRETSLPSLAYLCVCSDPTVKEGVDAIATAQSDLDFEVSTGAASVRGFLDAPFAGTRVIFSTYQSAQVVGAALKPGEAFDFAVFDEAHKTAGRDGRNYAFALEDAHLPIRKRLFLTATPRHYNPLKRDREGDAQLVFSMDRPDVYGPQAYRLTFAEAARRGIICAYKVIISVITSEMVTNELLTRAEVVVRGDAVRARQVANQIALRDAVAKCGVSKVFTFHKTVQSAASFVAGAGEGVGTHLPEFHTFHVNGTMPTARRERELREFQAAPRAVMSNARCLTEGVDVPAVDMVAFLSPRRSRVDIVQATGRAMRRSPGKTTGFVLVPLYVEQAKGESVEAAVSRASFDEVWDVLQSLQEQDDVLAEFIRYAAQQKGRGKGFDDTFAARIQLTGAALPLHTLRSAIATRCLEGLSASWDVMFGRLQAFTQAFGHCRVPRVYPTDPTLPNWVTNQRQFFRRKTLSEERVRRLTEAGFIWNTDEATWEERFSELVDFKRRHGHCSVPYDCPESPKLGRWVTAQRTSSNRGKLSPTRRAKLEGLGFDWSVDVARWEKMFALLTAFAGQHGHCRVPRRYPAGLAQWLLHQRQLQRAGDLSAQRRGKLERLGVIWEPFDDLWEDMFRQLLAFKRKHGHCNVPHGCAENTKLGGWVLKQRQLFAKKRLAADKKRRLESAGFDWNPNASKWEEMLKVLQSFKRQHGHCLVPADYVQDEALARWVDQQRQKRRKGKLDTERIDRLTREGFEWNPREAYWKQMLSALQQFKDTIGHSSVPEGYRSNPALARWVAVQRRTRRQGKLSLAKSALLDSLGFDWSPKTTTV